MALTHRSLKKIDKEGQRADRVYVTNPNSDPIPVNVIDGGGSGLNIYNEIASVASSTPTDIISYTVPAGGFILKEIHVSGTNIATYTIEIDSITEDKKRTYYTHFNETFKFSNLTLTSGQVLKVKVEHDNTSMTGDFNAKLAGEQE